MSNKIQVRRGKKKDMPLLAPGEIGLSLDEGVAYIGDGEKNIPLNPPPDSELSASSENAVQNKVIAAKIGGIEMDIAEIKTEHDIWGNDVVGILADFQNKTYTRLAEAKGLSAGSDFDKFTPFGGRKRCNVADDGTIRAYYGDDNYTEDGSNGQVMVYQPAFYYKMIPLKIEPVTDGIGYHIRKAKYYVSGTPQTGFKRHPAFYDGDGKEIDYILLSAFEGSLFDVSADDGAGAYLLNDEQTGDFTASTGDKLCSIAGVKPASGLTQNVTRPNIEQIAKNRGTGWHSYNIKAASANQLLMVIEAGTFNTQAVYGQGVVSITDNSAYNCSSLTGSTIGNGSGNAESTINDINGTQRTYTSNGYVSVAYRGMENPWGNIWDLVSGINIYGNGSTRGGIPYIANDFNYAESKHSGNYESAGFTLANVTAGYISAFGYSGEKFDWLFLPSETSGNSSLPVGDYTYVTANLNGYRIAPLGGKWDGVGIAGGFFWALGNAVGFRFRYFGGRLVYMPSASVI